VNEKPARICVGGARPPTERQTATARLGGETARPTSTPTCKNFVPRDPGGKPGHPAQGTASPRRYQENDARPTVESIKAASAMSCECQRRVRSVLRDLSPLIKESYLAPLLVRRPQGGRTTSGGQPGRWNVGARVAPLKGAEFGRQLDPVEAPKKTRKHHDPHRVVIPSSEGATGPRIRSRKPPGPGWRLATTGKQSGKGKR